MADKKYKRGQLVKVDIPDTYGKVIRVLKGNINFHKGEHVYETYQGGVVIQYRVPINTLAQRGLEHSVYPFNHTVFGKAFRVINPEEEISTLEGKLKGQLTEKERSKLKGEILYIKSYTNYAVRKHLPKKAKIKIG